MATPELDELFDFLNQKDAEPTVDPSLVEFDGFGPSGFIAPWRSAVMYQHRVEAEFSVEEAGYAHRVAMGNSGWYSYYYDTAEQATVAKDILGREYGAEAHWCFKTVTADVLNFTSDEARNKFPADLFYSWRTAGIGARKHIEFHYLMLPAAVHAVAVARGYDVPDFDVSPLFDLETDYGLGWNDMDDDEKASILAQCVPLVGGKGVDVADSHFWKQRVELWQSLGEEDPKVSQLPGDGKLATTSEKLASCLTVFYMCPWPNPLWARVVPVPSPRPDAITNAGKRLNVPILLDLYPSQAAAQEAAGTAGSTTSPAATGEPVVPNEWRDYPGEFKAEVKKMKESNKPLPVVFNEAGGEERFGCTLAELTTWLDHV